MASSSTSESDSLPVSSACKAQRWYESQSRRLNNEGEKIFPRFARTDRHYAPLCTAFRSASPNTKLLPTALHSISNPPSTFLDPPPAACRRTLPLTQQSRRMLENFPTGFFYFFLFFYNILCRKSAQNTHIACANTKCTQKTSI